MNWKPNLIVILLSTAFLLFLIFRVNETSLGPSQITLGDNSERSYVVTPEKTRQQMRVSKHSKDLNLAVKAPVVTETNSSREAEAFRLAEKGETQGEARELFSDLLKRNPKNTLAAQMLTELSKTPAEKTEAVAILRSTHTKCPSCNDLGLIAADLLLLLDRRSEAAQLSRELGETVTTESEKRHLASLLVAIGDLDSARSTLEKVQASRKRLKIRRASTSAAELTWEKIDSTELSSLTAPKG